MSQIRDQLQQLRGKTIPQLKAEEQVIRKELANLRIQLNMKKLKDTSKIKKAKKKLARVLTVVKETLIQANSERTS